MLPDSNSSTNPPVISARSSSVTGITACSVRKAVMRGPSPAILVTILNCGLLVTIRGYEQVACCFTAAVNLCVAFVCCSQVCCVCVVLCAVCASQVPPWGVGVQTPALPRFASCTSHFPLFPFYPFSTLGRVPAPSPFPATLAPVWMTPDYGRVDVWSKPPVTVLV
jgi:hypothetical protein